jgi:hypothetical protein
MGEGGFAGSGAAAESPGEWEWASCRKAMPFLPAGGGLHAEGDDPWGGVLPLIMTFPVLAGLRGVGLRVMGIFSGFVSWWHRHYIRRLLIKKSTVLPGEQGNWIEEAADQTKRISARSAASGLYPACWLLLGNGNPLQRESVNFRTCFFRGSVQVRHRRTVFY